MLKQRVLTAVGLLAVLLGALLAPQPQPLLLLLVLLASCALWEWLRLILPPATRFSAVAGGAAMFALLGFLAAQWFALGWNAWLGFSPAAWAQQLRSAISQWGMPLVALAWGIGATLAVARARASAPRGCATATFSVLAAVAAVIALWAALATLYQTHGAWLLISLMALVWCADVAAYFTGRALGRHKLAPKVSPGKTWEGAAGGVLAAIVWVLASAQWDGSFGAALAQRHSLPVVILLTTLLAALSIVGDLYESLLKRRAGVKDSSALLPGHGGVLDRIDALLPVAPAAYCLLHPWT